MAMVQFVSGFVEHHCDVHIAEPLTFMGTNLISPVSHTIDDTETYSWRCFLYIFLIECFNHLYEVAKEANVIMAQLEA